jgi:hypothetical protein
LTDGGLLVGDHCSLSSSSECGIETSITNSGLPISKPDQRAGQLGGLKDNTPQPICLLKKVIDQG